MSCLGKNQEIRDRIGKCGPLLGKLPLDDAKLTALDFIELGPLSPLHLLLAEGWATAGK
jgi:hypothetical protein